jgi:hypothetical protein
MATPPTPDLSSEGDDPGAFKNGTNGRGKGRRKGKKKAKKKTTFTNDNDHSNGGKPNGRGDDGGDARGAPPPQSATSSNGANRDPKRGHEDDDEDSGLLDLPSSQKKQRSTSSPSSPSSWSSPSSRSSPSSSPPSRNLRVVVMYLLFHALGMFVTVPLMLSMCASLGCGGREDLNRLVDMVISDQRRRRAVRSGSSGDDDHASPSSFSLVELMELLTVYSHQKDGISRGGDAAPDDEEIGRRRDRRREGGGEDEGGGGGSATIGNGNEVLLRSSSTDIIESMCHVASIAIGQFSLYLPYAQWLVLRNPLAYHSPPTAEVDSPLPSYGDNHDLEKIGRSMEERRGLFQRVMARRRAKNEERRGRGERAAASSSPSSAASEGIDRVHPIRHILEGASIFSHHRKLKRRTEDRVEKNVPYLARPRQRGDEGDNGVGDASVVDWEKWKYAMSDDYELGTEEIDLVRELARRVIAAAKDSARCPDDGNATDDCAEGRRRIASFSGGSDAPNRPFQERVDGVPWGGISDADITRWWPRKSSADPPTMISAHSEGGRILAAYLKIMMWPADLYPKFPFRLCSKGCGAEVSLLHTLEWREKYRPWCVSSETIRFNGAGFIYSRGRSNPGVNQRRRPAGKNGRSGSEGHSMVWYRPSLASPSDDGELYTRSIINVLDVAVSDSLIRNRGTIGRFNIVMDCGGMSSRNSPSIAGTKRLFSILQDHYPDRLGVLLVANLSGLAQMLMKMMLPFVTEDVRAKIHIVPNGALERREMLLQFMAEDDIPYYLGGKDDYEYDAKEYYQGKCILPEDAVREYITTMPFHA